MSASCIWGWMMPDFKVGDRVRRVRSGNADRIYELNNHPVGAEFTVDSVGFVYIGSADGRYCPMADCELIEEAPTCSQCGQPLPEPETITVPEHTLPWHLTVEPDNGAVVWTISAYGAVSFPYSLHSGNINFSRRLFNAGLLYATEAEAQARYEAIVAPTRREGV